MINLFHIPEYTINTGKFSNLLHDKIVTDFEQNFAKYVGAKYAVSFNSATSAIFLICKYLQHNEDGNKLQVPSLIPYVVPNAILNAGCDFDFVDKTTWVGHGYKLGTYGGGSIWDCAQTVKPNIYNLHCSYADLMIFSFYPTKSVGSCDGGMVVTDDEDTASWLRSLTMNGMSSHTNNWERHLFRLGHKMYMNSISAYIANENLKKLDQKRIALSKVAAQYNAFLGYQNVSDHLYRIRVESKEGNQQEFIKKAASHGITCGIHYHAAHLEPLYKKTDSNCPDSEKEAKRTVSIPFHEMLTDKEVSKIIDFVKANGGIKKQ